MFQESIETSNVSIESLVSRKEFIFAVTTLVAVLAALLYEAFTRKASN